MFGEMSDVWRGNIMLKFSSQIALVTTKIIECLSKGILNNQ